MESTAQALTTAADLTAQGLTPAQIAHLRGLAADYPLIELVDSRYELDRLKFLKWRHATGRLDD